jgi:hypothetical protein
VTPNYPAPTYAARRLRAPACDEVFHRHTSVTTNRIVKVISRNVDFIRASREDSMPKPTVASRSDYAPIGELRD